MSLFGIELFISGYLGRAPARDRLLSRTGWGESDDHLRSDRQRVRDVVELTEAHTEHELVEVRDGGGHRYLRVRRVVDGEGVAIATLDDDGRSGALTDHRVLIVEDLQIPPLQFGQEGGERDHIDDECGTGGIVGLPEGGGSVAGATARDAVVLTCHRCCTCGSCDGGGHEYSPVSFSHVRIVRRVPSLD